MQFMDDAIWALLEQGAVTPHEAFMKAIDKSRFKTFLPTEEQGLGDSAGAVPADAQRAPLRVPQVKEPRMSRISLPRRKDQLSIARASFLDFSILRSSPLCPAIQYACSRMFSELHISG
jgi:hypothetical protein